MSEPRPAKVLSFPQFGEALAPARAKSLMLFDPRSLQLRAQLERIGASNAPVLIIGETGTGKELVARQLHEHSHRGGAFVAVNCGAFSDSLAEAELFGHEVGAFTGAQHARAGWFEAADGGTLLLDEVGDMPLNLQVKLLRVLQEGQVVRLGSRKPIDVNVRVIAATNVDLERAVESGGFRRDLYYRLNVASVRLPPLRERPADIMPLVDHFLELYRQRLGMERAGLSAQAAQALQHYSWPGNIRELENVVHFGLIMCRDGLLEAGDLRLQSSTGAVAASPAPGDDTLVALARGMRGLLDNDHPAVYHEIERLLVTTAFTHCAGNQVHTAKRLGVSRNTVRAQLKRFGLLGREAKAQAEHGELVPA